MVCPSLLFFSSSFSTHGSSSRALFPRQSGSTDGPADSIGRSSILGFTRKEAL